MVPASGVPLLHLHLLPHHVQLVLDDVHEHLTERRDKTFWKMINDEKPIVRNIKQILSLKSKDYPRLRILDKQSYLQCSRSPVNKNHYQNLS